MIDIGRLVHLLIVRYNARCKPDASVSASIAAGEAMLHCVRNNNKNLNDSYYH